ncbi:rhodanese-like domain-containing protein [uncultured Cohaesibacter sp.]|uniref:rhodanese-like domain-containing protein n=1 Tax=uncultured Cohaesibacter sp. TaxID=1002546 RepID=UPI0029C6E1EA|nr:rhodanese-like domain-containing protein [uncultured Cohaesibacter sp.]
MTEAWELLAEDQGAVLIDVRTHAEWSYVGVPLLDDPARDVLMIEWLSYPAMQANPDFAVQLQAELSNRNVKQDAALLFLCRSGVRSKSAASVMTELWQGPCYNIASGFEGDLDEEKHRGHQNGWKQAGLPWRQF